jgi:hypothetical protein
VARRRPCAASVRARPRRLRRGTASWDRRGWSGGIDRSCSRHRERDVRRLPADTRTRRDDHHTGRLRRHARPSRLHHGREGRRGRRRRSGRHPRIQRRSRAFRSERPPRHPARGPSRGLRRPARPASGPSSGPEPAGFAGTRPGTNAGTGTHAPGRSTDCARACPRRTGSVGATVPGSHGACHTGRAAGELPRPGARGRVVEPACLNGPDGGVSGCRCI